jgi:hypothetical protein
MRRFMFSGASPLRVPGANCAWDAETAAHDSTGDELGG